jgi:hypothetical protein
MREDSYLVKPSIPLITWSIGRKPSLKMMSPSKTCQILIPDNSWKTTWKTEFTNSQVNFLVDSMDLDVVKLQNNTMSKGCVPLEQLFDRHDVYKGKNPKQQTDEALEFNIGTEIDPRMVKIGKGTTKRRGMRYLTS